MVYDALYNRRTTNDFDTTPVDDSVVIECVRAARYAPNHKVSLQILEVDVANRHRESARGTGDGGRGMWDVGYGCGVAECGMWDVECGMWV